jgi:hypothetical protein
MTTDSSTQATAQEVTQEIRQPIDALFIVATSADAARRLASIEAIAILAKRLSGAPQKYLISKAVSAINEVRDDRIRDAILEHGSILDIGVLAQSDYQRDNAAALDATIRRVTRNRPSWPVVDETSDPKKVRWAWERRRDLRFAPDEIAMFNQISSCKHDEAREILFALDDPRFTGYLGRLRNLAMVNADARVDAAIRTAISPSKSDVTDVSRTWGGDSYEEDLAWTEEICDIAAHTNSKSLQELAAGKTLSFELLKDLQESPFGDVAEIATARAGSVELMGKVHAAAGADWTTRGL